MACRRQSVDRLKFAYMVVKASCCSTQCRGIGYSSFTKASSASTMHLPWKRHSGPGGSKGRVYLGNKVSSAHFAKNEATSLQRPPNKSTPLHILPTQPSQESSTCGTCDVSLNTPPDSSLSASQRLPLQPRETPVEAIPTSSFAVATEMVVDQMCCGSS